MAANPRSNGIADDLKDIKRRLRNLEKATRLQSASIGSGGLTIRENGHLIVENGGDIILRGDDGKTIWSALNDPIKQTWVFGVDNAVHYPSNHTGTGYLDDSRTIVEIPDGYEHVAFMVTVSAGQSYLWQGDGPQSEGNITVDTYIKFWFDDGSTDETPMGNPINSGSNNISVAYSFAAWSFNRDLYIYPGKKVTKFQLGVWVDSNGDPASTTSGNWHIAGQVIFRRGEL